MAEPSTKWTCPLCTYANWPRSQRCTVCRTPRDLPSIEEEMHRIDLDESSCKRVTGGWICPACTYENWAASRRCTQCNTSAPHVSVSISSPGEQSTSTILAPLSAVGKWTCPSCTYANWPKSARCVMCAFSSAVPPNEAVNATANAWLDACKSVALGDDSELERSISSLPISCLQERRLSSSDCGTLDAWFTQNMASSTDSPFRPGLSLIELAQTCGQSDIVNLLLELLPTHFLHQQCQSPPEQALVSPPMGVACGKRSVCQLSPYAAKELRRHLDACVRQRKGDFCCSYLTEFGTFALPIEVNDLMPSVQEILLGELCDTDVQDELEVRSRAINWWVVEGQENQPTSRLFALWNRTDGDCLLDSLMQACWGIFDKHNTLRQALAESLTTCEPQFFRVWREYETQQAANQYRLDDLQILRDWRSSLEAANQPRGSLEQIHVFVLAHVLRRPIIVYSIKFIHNFRDEPIGFANYQGVYLPIFWDQSFCSRDPVVLGYTRGHFSALIPIEPNRGLPDGLDVADDLDANRDRHCHSDDGAQPQPSSSSTEPGPPPSPSVHRPSSDPGQLNLSKGPFDRSIYLPLFDRHGKSLPTPFASSRDTPSNTQLLRDYLETVSTRRGLLLARLRFANPSKGRVGGSVGNSSAHQQHHLVDTILRDWLTFYRSLEDDEEETAASRGLAGPS